MIQTDPLPANVSNRSRGPSLIIACGHQNIVRQRPLSVSPTPIFRVPHPDHPTWFTTFTENMPHSAPENHHYRYMKPRKPHQYDHRK